MKIVQVSFAETGGGAERVATDLHACFLHAGHDAMLLTPRPDPASRRSGVIPVDLDAGRSLWERTVMKIDRRLARPHAAMRRRRGFDDPHHPWTARLLDLLPWTPDVLHLHNLHGGWFDLRQLGPLSRRVPTVITLHDAWLPLSGPHWPMHVEQWDPAAQKANAALREEALSDAALTVVSPSRWMKDVWDASPWSLKVGDAVVIPNGIDLDIFTPRGAKDDECLSNVPSNAHVILSVGIAGRGTPSHTDPSAVLHTPQALPPMAKPIVVLNVGHPMSVATLGDPNRPIRVVEPGRIFDRYRLARLYRAASVLFHPVHEDNGPLTLIEALACGLPVVAPRVGGIPEIVSTGLHGRLYEASDHDARRQALYDVLTDHKQVEAKGTQAAEHARHHFDRRRMADDYLALYAEMG